jgi:hypothetical protein
MAIKQVVVRECDRCQSTMEEKQLVWGDSLPVFERQNVSLTFGDEVLSFKDLCAECSAVFKGLIKKTPTPTSVAAEVVAEPPKVRKERVSRKEKVEKIVKEVKEATKEGPSKDEEIPTVIVAETVVTGTADDLPF